MCSYTIDRRRYEAYVHRPSHTFWPTCWSCCCTCANSETVFGIYIWVVNDLPWRLMEQFVRKGLRPEQHHKSLGWLSFHQLHAPAARALQRLRSSSEGTTMEASSTFCTNLWEYREGITHCDSHKTWILFLALLVESVCAGSWEKRANSWWKAERLLQSPWSESLCTLTEAFSCPSQVSVSAIGANGAHGRRPGCASWTSHSRDRKILAFEFLLSQKTFQSEN